MTQIKKILFDLDGTLFDTQKIHAEVESALLAEKGIFISKEEISRRYAGSKTLEIFKLFLKSQKSAEEMLDKKWNILAEYTKEIKPLYKNNFFTKLHETGLEISLGTASKRTWAESLLKKFNIKKYFQEVVSGDDVKHGKPHPETWLLASGKINPENCLVVEDGKAGVEAAISAGIPALILKPNSHPKARQIECLDGIFDIL